MALMTEPPEEVNTILVFQDETGREWLAGAVLGPLTRFQDGQAVEWMAVNTLKDWVFTLHEFKVVSRG